MNAATNAYGELEALPASLDAERLILGAAQIDPQVMSTLREALAIDDFSLDGHRRIWKAACELYDKGLSVDHFTLGEELNQRRILEHVGGLSYLIELDTGLRISNVDTYVTIVKDKAALRRMLLMCDSIAKRCLTGEDAEQIRDSAVQMLGRIELSNSDVRPLRSIDEVPLIADCPSAELDYLIEPELAAGTVTALTGDSGSGKSSLALYWAGQITRQGTPVLILDRENPLAVVRERLARMHIPDGPELRYWGGWLPQEAPTPASPLVLDWATRTKRSLIVVDSLVAFHGGDENSAGEMRAFMHSCRRLADVGAAVLIVHHDGKSDSAKDYRGSSDFKAAVDAGFHVSNSSDDGRLGTIRCRCYKSRFGFAGELIYYYVGGEFRRDRSDNAPVKTAGEQLQDLLARNPGIGVVEFERLASEAGVGRNRARTFMNDGVCSGSIRTETGSRNIKKLFWCGGEV